MNLTKEDYEQSCRLVAEMHAAAIGEIAGPRRGVVEDVQDLRIERDKFALRIKELQEEVEHLKLAFDIVASTPSAEAKEKLEDQGE